jgi:hypothetical protein
LRGTRLFGNVMAMRFAPSKLFHAVVITGAALTGCGGAGLKQAASGATNGSPDATQPTATSGQDVTQSSGGTCPPGSELPYPPCYWIK